MKQFDSVLVANRGEIAVRVIRSAQQQGYRAIAVYSEADADALHVAVADEAVLIGPPAVAGSYLDPARIIDAARRTGAQAIHPGYGFLSENADFARACADAGLVFIGPTPAAIDVMGNKAASKRRMLEAGVPCIPGYQDSDQSDEALLSAARDIGMPLMVKAAAGGGGRGMRLVESLDVLPDALSAARSEALNAFGSDELILEKAVLRPRHVEIQVFGDSQGNVIHLGERDCSVQRRHQKVIEEAPCPVMTAELRAAMGEAAVNAARSIDYVGAGTVEFLLDDAGGFYFLEMNTRLQVEHPVTEMVTGIDLVALQFRIAQGYPLPMSQDAVALSGHAIEVRLYAEDSSNDFLPATGRAVLWQPPAGEGIRVDHGLLAGQEISPFYDPMIAKIIAWGEDRETARRRLVRALERTVLFGVPNNRRFLIDALCREDFADGAATTAFIDDNFSAADLQPVAAGAGDMALAAVLQYRQTQHESAGLFAGNASVDWGWRNGRPIDGHFRYGDGEQAADVVVREREPGAYSVTAAGQSLAVTYLGAERGHCDLFLLEGVRMAVWHACTGRGQVELQYRGAYYRLTNALAFTAGDAGAVGSGTVMAPMHGSVLRVAVAAGDTVEEGQLLAVMEAMKMEHRLIAEVSGIVNAVHVAEGEQVAADTIILDIVEE